MANTIHPSRPRTPNKIEKPEYIYLCSRRDEEHAKEAYSLPKCRASIKRRRTLINYYFHYFPHFFEDRRHDFEMRLMRNKIFLLHLNDDLHDP
jgi:hypothetical protein